MNMLLILLGFNLVFAPIYNLETMLIINGILLGSMIIATVLTDIDNDNI